MWCKQCQDRWVFGFGKTYNVGVAIYRFDDNFMTLYRQELEKYFGELGAKDGNTYKLDIQDGKQDQSTQTEQINNFIAQGKDVIIANLVDPTVSKDLLLIRRKLRKYLLS
ncbi:substrate-binding domain-containing protein [Erysipelothrix sp. D19-032]